MQSKNFILFCFFGCSLLDICTTSSVLSVKTKNGSSRGIRSGDHNSNLTKPVFTNCPTNSRKIEEYAEINTPVFHVHAEVPDEFDANCIRYKLSSHSRRNEKFWIGKVSGMIRTKTIFTKPSNISIKVIAVNICETNSTSICSFNVNINDINNNAPKFSRNKPVFKNCPTVPQKIEEYARINTPVFQVQAEVADQSTSKCIRYKLSSSPRRNVKFWIEKVSGMIHTRTKLTKPGNKSIKVIAMNICETNSSSICSFIVNIEDINNNAPKFTQDAYNMVVVENSVAGTYIGRISANDADYNENALLSYTWSEKKTNPETKAYFKMDGNTGEIFLARKMDKKVNHNFKLVARVKDHGKKPLSEECDVNVMVKSEIIPSFVNVTPANDSITINENFGDFETPIIRIQARSNSKSDERLEFELQQNCEMSRSADEPFKLYRESDPGLVNIKLLYGLDYNICKQYSLSIILSNSENGIAIKNMIINVDRSMLMNYV